MVLYFELKSFGSVLVPTVQVRTQCNSYKLVPLWFALGCLAIQLPPQRFFDQKIKERFGQFHSGPKQWKIEI